MIRTSAPFASWILQRQLTEMKEAAVTATVSYTHLTLPTNREV